MQYSTLLSDLRNYSDEDQFTEKELNIELPFQDDSHFKMFVINYKFRNKESEDDVRTILSSLEKDELLFNLIPITFNEELEGETQTSSLFIERKNFINIIWDFILLSFRFFSEPEGLAKCYYAEFKRLDKFCRKLNTPSS